MSESPQADRIVIAQLHGAAMDHVRWHESSDAETTAAVAELSEILDGRDDGPALLVPLSGTVQTTSEIGTARWSPTERRSAIRDNAQESGPAASAIHAISRM